MRIVSKEEFKKVPFGTLYILFEPCQFIDQPRIKSEPRGDSGESWWATDLLPWFIEDDYPSINYNDKDIKIKTESFCTDDAIYDHDSNIRFAIFDKEEIQEMISKLTELL